MLQFQVSWPRIDEPWRILRTYPPRVSNNIQHNITYISTHHNGEHSLHIPFVRLGPFFFCFFDDLNIIWYNMYYVVCICYTCCILYIIYTIIHYYTLLIVYIYILHYYTHNMASKLWYDFEPHCHSAPTAPVWMAWPCPLRVSWGAAGAWSRGSHPNNGLEYVWSVCYIGRCLGGSPQLHHCYSLPRMLVRIEPPTMGRLPDKWWRLDQW